MTAGIRLKRLVESSRIVRRVLDELRGSAAPGVTTSELDEIARRLIEEEKGVPSFLGYRGYPASICASVNSEVVHGIPGGRKLAEGDLLSVDVGVYKDGFHGDAADSFFIDHAPGPKAQLLLDVTYEARRLAIEQARQGNRIGDLGAAVQEYVEAHGFGVVRDLVGHGIGRRLHEPPQIPNFGARGRGPRISEGMALAIEPMVNEGTADVIMLDDGWTVVTADGRLSAHAEHTVIVTSGEALVLTA